ncbi:MAG: cation:dicarboxylase symporter family transporter, partial [Selenomonadaceae bacterium]|nr:cation:dicarboxylase symporter family transporter [Selenomonadaceae bacterium]
IVSMIIFFVPLIVFLAMATLFFNMETNIILMMGKLIISLLLACVILFGVYMLLIRLVGKISPLSFAKKIPSLMPIPFATSSSAVTMPFTMKFCTDKLGISPKISSFSIPIGVTVNMDGGCIYLPLAAIMFIKMYGVDVDLDAITIILAMTVSLSIAGPAVPNAAVIGIITITSIFGVPNDIAGILFCINTFCDRIVTCFNVIGDLAVSTSLARTENLVDEKIYFNH